MIKDVAKATVCRAGLAPDDGVLRAPIVFNRSALKALGRQNIVLSVEEGLGTSYRHEADILISFIGRPMDDSSVMGMAIERWIVKKALLPG